MEIPSTAVNLETIAGNELAPITASDWGLLALFVLGALSISFICSLLEAVVMSVDEFKLRSMASTGDKGASRMLKLKESPEDSIAAILSLNTVAHTVGATLSGAQAMKMFGSEMMGIFSGILTLLILVLTEIIPKNAGERHAETFSSFVSLLLLKVVNPLMTPIVWANRWLVKVMFGKREELVERESVIAMQQLAFQDGAIDEDESEWLSRALSIGSINVGELMISRLVMPSVPSSMTLLQLASGGDHARHTRVLVHGSSIEEIVGYANLEDAFQSVVLGVNGSEATLGEAKIRTASGSDQGMIHEVLFCKESTAARVVFEKMLSSGTQIAAVLGPDGSTVGAITLEEFLEYLIGQDIRDEDDPAEDLKRAGELAMAAKVASVKGTVID